MASGADLLVAAASDLIPAQIALAEGFESLSGHTVVFNFGSSGRLAHQIRNGAPFDVYLSANEQFAKELLDLGFVSSFSVYAEGRLGIWSRSRKFDRLEKLASEPFLHLAIANPAHAPYGEAAKEALMKARLWKQVESRIVYGENVRQAYEFARTGNADVTITSWTLVHAAGGHMVPPMYHSPIRQAGGVVNSSRRPELARKFMEFLLSPAGQKILAANGLFAPGAHLPKKSMRAPIKSRNTP